MTFSNVIRFDVVDSTNRFVADAAAGGAEEGLVAVAEEQRAGRGRLGRTWVAQRGEALLCSLLFRPVFGPSEAFVLPFLVALCAADASEELAGVPIGCKWPNDLVYEARKLAGVLAEFVPGSATLRPAVVVGVGLNLAWSEGGDGRRLIDGESMPPVGLNEIAGRVISRDVLLTAFLARVDDRYATLDEVSERTALVREYAARCVTIGRFVRVTTPTDSFEGRAVELADDGRLVVERRGGTVRLEAADVVHLRDG